jgi:hypothetical protein
MKAAMVFTGSGPILILTSYPSIDDPNFISKLKANGIKKNIVSEIPKDQCQNLYASNYFHIVGDLRNVDDMRGVDYDGHRILNNFSLKKMGKPFIYED